MADRANGVLAIHSAITNMLIGTLTGSVLSSIYYVTQFIEKVNWQEWYEPKYLIGLTTALVYYLILLIAYKDLFVMHSPQNTYTVEVIPKIDSNSPWVKHVNYLIMFFYLLVFAFLPVFMMNNLVVFLFLFAGISGLDLVWESVVKSSLNKWKISISDRHFSKYLGIWSSYDCACLFVNGALALSLPGLKKAYGRHADNVSLIFLGFILVILIMYCVLSAVEEP